MYAVPWLVTLFADMFPSRAKTLYLWDTMVVFGGEFAVFVAASVLVAHRRAILAQGDFSMTMMFFSRLNDGDVNGMCLRYVVLKSLSIRSWF